LSRSSTAGAAVGRNEGEARTGPSTLLCFAQDGEADPSASSGLAQVLNKKSITGLKRVRKCKKMAKSGKKMQKSDFCGSFG